MNHVLQYDQFGASYAGHGPFSPTSSGKVRIMNVAYDYENGNRPVDAILQLIPNGQMATYTDLLQMSYNSPVMPWNNDVPATQFRLTESGLVALGYGGLPAHCTSTGNLVDNEMANFCADVQGRGKPLIMSAVFLRDELNPAHVFRSRI